jgi:hypothetical protein
MTSSLRAARVISRCIVEELHDGQGGFCGTMFGTHPKQEVHGAWVYRVKPTGPIERDWQSHWTTSFPVRVLEISDIFGEPDKNNLTLPAIRNLDDFAAELFLSQSRDLKAWQLEAARQAFFAQWVDEGARLLRSQRRQHRKLAPDPRYKRTKSGKHNTGE